MDSKAFLFRLLLLKLGPHGVRLKQVFPDAFLTSPPPDRDTQKCAVIIVPLPQPGLSSHEILDKAHRILPGRRCIILLDPEFEGQWARAERTDHIFHKPLNEQLDHFLSLIKEGVRLASPRVTRARSGSRVEKVAP